MPIMKDAIMTKTAFFALIFGLIIYGGVQAAKSLYIDMSAPYAYAPR